MKELLLLSAIALCASISIAQNIEELTTARVYANRQGEILPYRLYTPNLLSHDQALPLVLFLHGAGERGDDNLSQLRHGVEDIIKWSHANEPLLICAPQCPAGEKWADVDWSQLTHSISDEPAAPMRLALEIIDALSQEFKVDKKRVYITGLSMGGYGTWDVIQRYPDKFAAAMPICGGGDPAGAVTFKNLPIWVFHGDKDKAVPVSRSRDMVEALRKVGSPVKYTEYANVGHNCWTQTYADSEILNWFFKQKR